ncbi:HK97 family phage prohead protease [Mycobacteroides abscessus]|uniref:HK97 family phage prohead protease n=1 Tax=Mycobacteroides abscessus TaxID=36809 RepID=UPI00307AE116
MIHLNQKIKFRSAELTPGTGRTIFGIAVPYGQVTEIDEFGSQFLERFEYGAFAKSIAERGHKVKLLTSHNSRTLALGKAVDLREQQDGLHASFEVAETRDGDEALALVRSGTVDSFSVGFSVVRERWDGEVRTVTEAILREVSLVNFPAYQGAVVGGVRSAAHSLVIPRSVAQAWIDLLNW